MKFESLEMDDMSAGLMKAVEDTRRRIREAFCLPSMSRPAKVKAKIVPAEEPSNG